MGSNGTAFPLPGADACNGMAGAVSTRHVDIALTKPSASVRPQGWLPVLQPM